MLMMTTLITASSGLDKDAKGFQIVGDKRKDDPSSHMSTKKLRVGE